ncbi:hypothetical protein CH251_14130 [Rhodococcus sp. 06-462-5]|nr:hypothetical protein CH251_14130 [Rhodococcus sp. 06-462-5]OZE63473.1 hypothetical protein CH270_18505 [Rhodococcus sp. 02-925g]
MAALFVETGLAITVCHLLPGTSKVSRDRASLALHIPIYRCGMTLTGHKVIVETVGATNITTVSTVHAECDRAQYRVGVMPRHDIERPRWWFMSSCFVGCHKQTLIFGESLCQKPAPGHVMNCPISPRQQVCQGAGEHHQQMKRGRSQLNGRKLNLQKRRQQ